MACEPIEQASAFGFFWGVKLVAEEGLEPPTRGL